MRLTHAIARHIVPPSPHILIVHQSIESDIKALKTIDAFERTGGPAGTRWALPGHQLNNSHIKAFKATSKH
jgi:hypothetical protein